jgi:hypothetical protein
MRAIRTYISAKKLYSLLLLLTAGLLAAGFVYVKRWYANPDFGSAFGPKAERARRQLERQQANFETCAKLCGVNGRFLQALVFPEVMRYNTLKDGIEAESLRTLYVQFGSRYADFSVGLFQMKPTFAETVEQKVRQLLPESLRQELQLDYAVTDAEEIRRQRVERLLDEEWQLVYITAFTAVCNRLYAAMPFTTQLERLQWYATVYNAGFDKPDEYIRKKISQENFYLQQGMPGKKFRYAAIVAWYFTTFASQEGPAG